MKIVVIGAVAAGTSAAAKARRNNDSAKITIYEKDEHISYSGCGMPYFIGGVVQDVQQLTPRDPAFFAKKYNIDILTLHEVLSVNTSEKYVEVKNLATGEIFTDTYDKLIFATGATAFKPQIEGIDSDNTFVLRTIKHAVAIDDFVKNKKPKTAVIVGTGFIGLELCENLRAKNIDVTLVEIANKITPNLDEDMANMLEKILIKNSVNICKSSKVEKILGQKVYLQSGESLSADMVIIASGVRPNVSLAKKAGINIGETGAISVNANMQTNIKDVYACGDCIQTFSCITGEATYMPLGSTANKTGRIAGDCVSGGNMQYKGLLGTGIFKVFNTVVATTGLTQQKAESLGYEIQVCHNIKPDKPQYLGGKEMTIKAVADKKTNRLLGVQIIGAQGVDKRIDVFATLITYKANVDELFHLDLAYAPPFSTTKDPVHYTGMILDNAINNARPIITSNKLDDIGEIQLIDARSNSDYTSKGTVKNAKNVPHAKLRNEMENLDKNKPTVVFCNKGVTGNAAQNILLGNGFEEVYNLSGGHKFYKESK